MVQCNYCLLPLFECKVWQGRNISVKWYINNYCKNIKPKCLYSNTIISCNL